MDLLDHFSSGLIACNLDIHCVIVLNGYIFKNNFCKLRFPVKQK